MKVVVRRCRWLLGWLWRRWWLVGVALGLSAGMCVAQLWLLDLRQALPYRGWWTSPSLTGVAGLLEAGERTPLPHRSEGLLPVDYEVYTRAEWDAYFIYLESWGLDVEWQSDDQGVPVWNFVRAKFVQFSYGMPFLAYRQQLFTCDVDVLEDDPTHRSDHDLQRAVARWVGLTPVEFRTHRWVGDDIEPSLRTKGWFQRQTLLPWVTINSPERVLWAGLAGNLGFWWMVFFGLLLVPGGLRRLVRRVRGRCLGCGYEVGGLSVCPECGRQRMPL